jgi:uncharacterized protein (TIGR03437 family)
MITPGPVSIKCFYRRSTLCPGVFFLGAIWACTPAAVAQSPCSSAGSGAATPGIQQSFKAACDRGTFSLTTPQALGDVKGLSGASPALVQEFGPAGATSGTPKAALIKPDPNAPTSRTDTLQVYTDIYSFYTTVGAATAGVPVTDTQACPSNSFGVCDYQQFTKNYALFVFSTTGSQNISVADPFYTAWTATNGISGALGVATASASAVVSQAQTSGTQQTFAGGAIFSYTLSGATVTYPVSGPIYMAFQAAGGFSAAGFPTSQELTLASGVHRQTFQAARIEWTPGQDAAVVFFPITNLDILGEAQGATINAGASITLTATALDSRNNTVTNRVLTWSTANGSVASVVGNGVTATVQGVASGTTNIYVSAEGKTSPPFSVTVRGVCCNIGEGAPTQAVTLAFQAAAARNKLAVTLPNPQPVTRAGAGYVQVFSAADGSGTIYVIALSDKSNTAYVLSGPLYAAYLTLGGFSGVLGYPSSDLLPGGAQTFESGVALAGNPVQLVPAAVAKRWFSAGGPTGALGAPSTAAVNFVAFSGDGGTSQLFAGGAIYAYVSGARAGSAFVSAGLVLARYLALSGPAGELGGPISDLANAGPVQSQNFEGGFIDLQPGAAAAVEHLNPRKPAVTVQPATVGPGGRVHVNISGFAPGAGISVTVTGQAAFNVSPASGSFSWDIAIAPNARPATLSVQAHAVTGSDMASAAYAITSVLALLPKWTAVSGDRQNGAPGAALQLPVVALLSDANGNPIPNTPVTIVASPGASVSAPTLTDGAGLIAATLRMPAAPGVAVLSLTAAGQVITFSELSVPSSIRSFPVFPAADNTPLGGSTATFAQQGSLLYTLAGLIRSQQNAGLLTSPNGLATPASLNQYLLLRGGYTLSENGAPIANPWLAAQYAGVNASVSTFGGSADTIRDLVNSGSPVGVVLNLSVDGRAAGTTVVSAIGIDATGAILISDPNPAYARSALTDYLAGFTEQGHTITATIASLLRMMTTATAGGFVAASVLSAGATVHSVAGPCGGNLDLNEPASTGKTGGVRFIECDETQPLYEAAFQTNSGATVLDLTGGAAVTITAGATRAFQISRSNGALKADPEHLAITSITDAAVFGPNLSPGELFSIFGTGFMPDGSTTPTVTVNGQPVSLLASLPFQINAPLPPDLTPGDAIVQIANALGTVSQTVTIGTSSPTIFVLGANFSGGQRGAIVNQDGSINSLALPALRGQGISIYCTGLGATSAQTSPPQTASPVTVIVNGTRLNPTYAGVAPGFVGLYQVNVQIPATVFPALSSSLQLEQNGRVSNAVAFALQ